jgi:hypothetical protein
MPSATTLPYVFDAPIRTDRLTLRLLTADDVDDVYTYQSREDVCRYMLYEPRTRDEVAERNAKNALVTSRARDGDYLQIALSFP